MALRRTALGLAVLTIVIDQATKWAVVSTYEVPGRHLEVTSFFNLVLTCNPGVSFGQLGDLPPWLLIVLSLVIVVGLLIWLRKQTHWLPALAIGLIVGGAIGNVIDRLRVECVIDFLDFHALGWHWPAFNVADSAITVGVIMLLVDGLFLNQDEGKRKA